MTQCWRSSAAAMMRRFVRLMSKLKSVKPMNAARKRAAKQRAKGKQKQKERPSRRRQSAERRIGTARHRHPPNHSSRLANKIGRVTPHFAAVEHMHHSQLLNGAIAELAQRQMHPFLLVPLREPSPTGAGRS